MVVNHACVKNQFDPFTALIIVAFHTLTFVLDALLESLDLLPQLTVDELMVDSVHSLLVVLHGLILGPTALLLLKELVKLFKLILIKVALEEELEGSQIVESVDSLLICKHIAVPGGDGDVGQSASSIA